MQKSWTLEVSSSPKDDHGSGFSLDLIQKQGASVRLLANCQSLDHLEREMAELKSDLIRELDRTLEEARVLAASEQQDQKETPDSPEEIWAIMEPLAEEDFCAYFNGLDEETRRKVAEFVFTQVNMFKGKGPVFAARFDNGNSLLS